MIGVVDYGMGNLLSVANALELVGATVRLCRNPEDLAECDHFVLPGVGAFGDGMAGLRRSGMIEALDKRVRKDARPLLGICLGMQVLARESCEGGIHAGLGWIPADVVALTPSDPQLRVPHMGWNDIVIRDARHIFKGLPTSSEFYFVHSYYMKCDDDAFVPAECDYGGRFACAVAMDNIVATQFHPEKSQYCGLKVLSNFVEWRP
jgi:glutamine amidotransferase